MKNLLCAVAALGLLSACTNEPEVAEDDTVLADAEVNETALEPVTTSTWDSDADGQFQQAEYTAVGETFGTWDADSDGTLTEEEFGSGWTDAGWDNSAGAFTAFDDSGDGLLDNDEFFADDEWSEWDANSDGVLDTNEWTY